MLDRIIAARVFIETVERGSATAAAGALGMSRAMASRYLAAMEEWTGARLVHRSTRHMGLTAAGATILERCRALLAVADGITDLSAAAMEPQGWLRVAAPAIFADACLVPLLGRFAERYPKVVVDLQATDRTVDLVQDRIDVAFRIAGALDRAVIARRLGAVRSALVASPDYVARAGAPESPAALTQHACLTYAHFDGRDWRLAKGGTQMAVEVAGPLQTNETLLVLRATLGGMGIAILPAFAAAPYLASGALVPVLAGWRPADLSLYALYASRRHLPAGARALIDFVAAGDPFGPAV